MGNSPYEPVWVTDDIQIRWQDDGDVLIRFLDLETDKSARVPDSARLVHQVVSESPSVASVRTKLVDSLETIKTLTGLSWDRVGELIGVSRQTTVRWRAGEPADDANVVRVNDLVSTVNDVSLRKGRGQQLRMWLDRFVASEDETPFQMLKDQRFDEVKVLGRSAHSTVKSVSEWARDDTLWEDLVDEHAKTYID